MKNYLGDDDLKQKKTVCPIAIFKQTVDTNKSKYSFLSRKVLQNTFPVPIYVLFGGKIKKAKFLYL